ncbi:hypothetical protein PMIN07_008616 [Paraphaeosphaeria minitans]
MSAIRLGAAINVREFQSLINSLDTHQDHAIDSEALQDEFGRFRTWNGNLDVPQKCRSSLDYRLRDAPLLSNEVSKLLKELEENLHASNRTATPSVFFPPQTFSFFLTLLMAFVLHTSSSRAQQASQTRMDMIPFLVKKRTKEVIQKPPNPS